MRNPYTKFQKLTIHGSKVMPCIFSRYLYYKVKMLKLSKGHHSRKNLFFFFSKVNQIIYSSPPISLSSFKAIVLTFFRYLAYKVKMPKFSKGHNYRKNDCYFFFIFFLYFFFIFFQKLSRPSTHNPLSAY